MEAPQATLQPRLAVVLKNVRALREAYDYVARGDIEKDLISAQQELLRHLRQSVQLPDGWLRPYSEDGNIWLRPDKKWKVSSKAIAISVCLPSPTGGDGEDQDASVNLYVPSSWKLRGRKRFTDSLRSIVPRAKDWAYIRDEPDEIDPEYPMGKWIRYEGYAGSTGFDTAGFFQAITGAVNEFLELETKIDSLLESPKR